MNTNLTAVPGTSKPIGVVASSSEHEISRIARDQTSLRKPSNPNETSNAPSRPLCSSAGFSVFGLAILGLLLLQWNPVFAQTEVSGEVSGVWDTESSPYLIVDRPLFRRVRG